MHHVCRINNTPNGLWLLTTAVIATHSSTPIDKPKGRRPTAVRRATFAARAETATADGSADGLTFLIATFFCVRLSFAALHSPSVTKRKTVADAERAQSLPK